MSSSLESLRAALDQVDQRLIEALAERQRLVLEVAGAKVQRTDPLRDPAREEDVLTRLVEMGKRLGLDGFFVTRLFREVLEQSLRIQQERLGTKADSSDQNEVCVVAYQGSEGAYSHLAAMRHFGARAQEAVYRGHKSFSEILDAVAEGSAHYAVLPIENTTAGSINESYDLLLEKDLALVGEEVQRVEHCLVALADVPLSNIRRIYSHPQALAQCSRFLGGLDHCHVESFLDTAMSVQKIVAEQDLSQAAIASEEAARLHGLPIIKRDIANQRENYTRFVVVARRPVAYDTRIPCKTSLILATRHEEGALLACLNVLAQHHLNLTKLESRPRPHVPWEYLFYIDFEGNLSVPEVQTGLQALATKASFLKVLGSYPARTIAKAQPVEPRQGPMVAEAKAKEDGAPTDAPKVAPQVFQVLEKKAYKLASRAHRQEDTVIRVGRLNLGGDNPPLVIAGPCGVESREQLFACAKIVKEMGAQILRAGCFKPRTSPYSFQGMGYEGLDLLEEAGRTFDLPIITEVMEIADVERVARQCDILQIGTRNMQNFPLLKEVGRVDRPVMLKRGMMASIDEWLQAAEYILASGNQQVILCERGIRTFETSTRATLDLSAIPVLHERTHLPVVVDPSHAAGTWRWVTPLTEASIAVGAHGVMVEIHPEPEKALSDGPQALTFERFTDLMERVRRLSRP